MNDGLLPPCSDYPLEPHHVPESNARESPSFVDLRRFAAGVETGALPPTARSEEAFLESRHVLEQPDGPVEIGAIRLSVGQGTVAELPADEFVIVSSGTVTLMQPAGTLVLADGASAACRAVPDSPGAAQRRPP